MQILKALVPFFIAGNAAGGGTLTPPASLIGAAPQLNFSDIANTGGYLMNTAAAGTIVSDGGYYDAGAGGWVAKDAASVGLQMNGALGGFVLYANAGLTPGGTFSPTPVIQYLGTGSPVSVTPIIEAQGGVYVDGGAAPAAAATGLALYYAGGQANIAARTFPSGAYQAINIQSADFLIQNHNGATVSAWEFDAAGQVIHTKGAQTGVAEIFLTVQTADDATGAFQLINNSASNGVFLPEIRGTSPSSLAQGLVLHVLSAVDAGGSAAMRFRVEKSNLVPLVTAPLYDWTNSGSTVASLIPLGAGAQAAFMLNSAAAALPPAFTTRSTGTRYIVYPNISGAAADFAIGIESNNMWFSTGTTSTGFKFYGGVTLATTISGAGTIDTVGGVYVSGVSPPAAGSGPRALIQWNGSAAVFAAFNYTGSVYLPARIQASTITLEPSGTAVVTIGSTAIACAQPLGVPSFTVAGVPSAATAGQIIYVSNESGGAVLAFSDGTNWRRVTDRAIIT